MKKITYSSNNSGGNWWLSDQDWKNLEAAGWKVEWRPERWLGALATEASLEEEGLTERVAIAKWADVVDQDPYAQGCNCCGQPHNFYDW